MSGPTFQQVEELFHEALALAPEARGAFLESKCAGDAELRAAVEELLRHDRHEAPTDTFLASPLADAAARLRADVPTQADVAEGNTCAPQGMPEIPGYEIQSELGRGGMGVVHKARHIGLNRLVAVKMLRPDSAAGPETLARFRIEAEALARLQHPNIIAIYDIGTAEGRPFFSMEYVAGGSLAQILDGRPQDIMGSARILETLARTMADVHRQGIVHRDLKPANILLSTESKGLSSESAVSLLSTQHSVLITVIPKISDFGLAKIRSTGNRLTASGIVMGTLCYMAPEQARSAGRTVGPPADQFALGAMLYEMLTGRPPFDAPTAAETITQLLNDDPLPPQRLRPRVPRDLATICLKCLERSPRARYASCLELADDLRRFQGSKPIHARPVGPLGRLVRWCRRRPLLAASLLLSTLLALALIVTILVYEAELEQALAQTRGDLRQAVGTVEFEREQIVEANVKIGHAELERADAFVALLRFTEALRLDEGHPEQEREHRRRIAATLQQCPRLVQFRMHRQRVLCARLDRDEGWLALVGDDQRVQICAALSGRPVGPALKVPEPVERASLSPDGRSLLTVGSNGTARLWDVEAGTVVELPGKEEQAVAQVLSHPDGLVLLSRHVDRTIRLWDLTRRPLALPRPLSGGPVGVAALNDGTRWLFTVDAKHVGQLWDVATGSPEGKPVRSDQAVSLAAVSPAGRRVAVLGSDRALRIWDVSAGKWLGNPLRSAQTIHQLTFAPDEERVLVSVGAERSLQIWRPESNELVVVLAPVRAATEARFSPNGSLVIATDDAGAGRVWDAATGRAITPPLRHGGPMVAVAASAAGRNVVTVGREGTVASWLLPGDETRGSSKDRAPDQRPVTELVRLAQLLAGGRIDDKQQRQDLSPEDLWAAWQATR
jgi:eukaryotic-like serine/threonine-protein kinase